MEQDTNCICHTSATLLQLSDFLKLLLIGQSQRARESTDATRKIHLLGHRAGWRWLQNGCPGAHRKGADTENHSGFPHNLTDKAQSPQHGGIFTVSISHLPWGFLFPASLPNITYTLAKISLTSISDRVLFLPDVPLPNFSTPSCYLTCYPTTAVPNTHTHNFVLTAILLYCSSFFFF